MYIPGDPPKQTDILLDAYHGLCDRLGELPGTTVRVWSGPLNDTLPRNQLLQVVEGTLDVTRGEKVALVLQPGDLFQLPDLDPLPLGFYSEERGQINVVSPWLNQSELDDQQLQGILNTLILQNQILTLAFASATRENVRPTPGFRRVRKGSVLIRSGTPSEEVYTLMRGRARVEVEGVTVGSVEEGEIFGVLSALTEGGHKADVFAETDVTLMSVPSDQFIRLIQAQPETFMRLLRTLSRHITELNQRLLAAQQGRAAGSGTPLK